MSGPFFKVRKGRRHLRWADFTRCAFERLEKRHHRRGYRKNTQLTANQTAFTGTAVSGLQKTIVQQMVKPTRRKLMSLIIELIRRLTLGITGIWKSIPPTSVDTPPDVRTAPHIL
jgi:hypothetical protein